jgi:DNA topoisomerase-2
MYLIGKNGAVKKYASPEEILVEYLEMRLALYKVRKSYLLKEMKKDIAEQTMRARFISDVSQGVLKIFQRRRKDIEDEMTQRGYTLDLLTSVRTYQYTQDEINKSIDMIQKLHHDISVLETTHVSNLWKQDLESL